MAKKKKNLVGIDLGNGEISIYYQGKMVVKNIPSALIEDHSIESRERLGQFIADILDSEGIKGRDAALVLPETATYFKTIRTKPMSDQELKLNLPFEFKDYLGNESANYNYDYAVNEIKYSEEGEPEDMELFVAAGHKDSIASAEVILRAAGMRLTVAIPREMAIINLFLQAGDNGADIPREYCIVDVGFTRTRVYIITDGIIQGSKTVDQGVGRIYSSNGISPEEKKMLYDNIAIEIMKAINFYRYEHQDSEISDVHFCGTESINWELRTAILNALNLREQSINDILPEEAKHTDGALRSIVAIGATL